MRGIDPSTPFAFVVEEERELPVKQQTIFKLKNLTVRESEQIKNSLFTKQGIGKKTIEQLLIGSQERQSLEIGLVGWENFVDQDNKPIPFSKQKFDYIPAKYRAEIALEIRGESELSEEEVKN